MRRSQPLRHQANPPVMHADPGREGQKAGQEISTQGHAAAAVTIAQQIVPEPWMRPIRGQQRRAQKFPVSIDNFSVAQYELRLRRRFVQGRHPTGKPFVILIGQQDPSSPRLRKQELEVCDRPPEAAFPEANARIPKRAHQAWSSVIRSVIPNQQLILGRQLRQDGTNLALQEVASVVTGQADALHASAPGNRPSR